jgi:class 3 adenylate cyclase/tetratricopeptide (TPR) repeat protein
MPCPRCGSEAPADADFCPECGAKLAVACAQCGTTNVARHKFCKKCGEPLGGATTDQGAGHAARTPEAYVPRHLAEKILTSRSALEGERKQVTVLFADLKGSMELLADRDPEEARNLLDPVLARMMEAVHRYEGTVNQVMGDGIMALFGAPLAHEDHAVRACYAALDMQASMRRYTEEVRRAHGIELQIRVGLNSGEVVVRAIGGDLRMDYSAVGQTTHLAARMEQLATPGAIRLTAATLRLAEGYITVKPLGPVPVKGLESPIDVYEMVGAGPRRSRLHAAAARGLSRFVGRDGELEQLHRALGFAGAGHGQVLALVGEAGVGKSRLVWEVTHSYRTHGWVIIESRSVSYGKATPYLPVVDLLKAYFQIQERDEGRAIREKVVGKLLALDRTLEPTLPVFLALLDVAVDDPDWQGLDPVERRRRTLDAVKRLLLRESQVQPVLVVFEDLHWIDAETQALLDRLVEGVPTARMLLLVNYRPEYRHDWGRKTYYTQVRLDPLSPENADELLRSLLGAEAARAPLARTLIRLSEGNPFFLEECVQNLVEASVLIGERGAYRLQRDVPVPQVPATVQAVLAARIDRLPSEEKRLLQCAAVVGKDVPLSLLRSIAELPEESLERGLAHLQAAEFLYETSIVPDLEYTFKHALTHEVAYGSLLQDHRRALHARILAALEGPAVEGTTEHVDRLAYHAIRGGLWDKGVRYLREAVARALARSAHREAVAGVEQALAALAHLPESRTKVEQAIDLRFELRIALWPLGAMDRILDILREAERLAESLGDRRRMGFAAGYLCGSFYGIAEHDRAVAAGERARAHSESGNALDLRVLAGSFLGQAYRARTDYARAVERLEATLGLLDGPLAHERFGQSTVPSVLTRVNLVNALVELGRFPEALRRSEEAIQISEALNHPASRLLAWWARGMPFLRQGHATEAVAALEQSVRIGHDAELPTFLHWSGPALATAYALAGRMSEAFTLLERVLEQDVAMNLLSQHTLTTVYMADAHMHAGHLQEAAHQAIRAEALARERNEQGYEAWACRLLGEIASRHEPPDLDGAAASYQRALGLAEELGMRPLAAHCHLGLGGLYRRAGQRALAQEQLTRAATMCRDMQMPRWLDHAEEELGKLNQD